MSETPKQRIDVARFDPKMAPAEITQTSSTLRWHTPDTPPFQLVGFHWFTRDHLYRRLPVVPAGQLREPVDQLANCTAGGQIRFHANTSRLAVRVQLRGPADMNHMPATGQCGYDLYLGSPGEQTFYNSTKYDHRQTRYEVMLFERPKPESHHFTLNFPLYQGVNEVFVGLDPHAAITPPLPWAIEHPVVFYGTSITQGGCASRPGMAFTNILSRMLNIPIINLGFSGNGQGDPEVASIIASMPHASLFVLDYEGNCHELPKLQKTLPVFIDILRRSHPTTPILVVSRIPFAAELVDREQHDRSRERADFQRQTVADRHAAGDHHIFFHDGSDLLGAEFHECTVDGVHPTDLGFLRIAENLAPDLQRILHQTQQPL